MFNFARLKLKKPAKFDRYMDIKGTTVVHLAQYAAPYLGNFVKSLMCLERRIAGAGGRMIYVFPPQASGCA